MFEIKDGKIDGLKIIVPNTFEDYRGFYTEIFDDVKYEAILPGVKFVQDDISISRKNVLRGLHGNFETGKLITIVHGSGYCLWADNRPASPTYKQWQALVLSQQNRIQVYVPPGIGNSVLALDDNIVYFYKQTSHFEEYTQFTIQWNDPEWNFWWPTKNPILSQRDTLGEYVKDATFYKK